METAYLKIHNQRLDNLPAYRRSQRNSRSNSQNNSRSTTPNEAQSPSATKDLSKEETPAEVDQKAYDMKTALGQVAAGVAMGPAAGHGNREGSWSEGWKGEGGSRRKLEEGWKGEGEGERVEEGKGEGGGN